MRDTREEVYDELISSRLAAGSTWLGLASCGHFAPVAKLNAPLSRRALVTFPCLLYCCQKGILSSHCHDSTASCYRGLWF